MKSVSLSWKTLEMTPGRQDVLFVETHTCWLKVSKEEREEIDKHFKNTENEEKLTN